MTELLKIVLAAFLLYGCSGTSEMEKKELSIAKSYNETIEVLGRQGLATDGEFIFVSGTKELFKYTLDGKLLAENLNPFKGIAFEVNHIGDIDVKGDEIYSCVERFANGRGDNFVIAIYSKDDLSLKRILLPGNDSPQNEVSGIAIDTERSIFWLSDWTDSKNIYYYDLNTGEYRGKIVLKNDLLYPQGVFVYNNYLLVTADNGDAENNESDHLYAIRSNPFTDQLAVPIIAKVFSDVKREGEIEGLTINKNKMELLVLFNRGARIIKGIPAGFYPGFEKEIHEIYSYKICSKFPED